MTLDEQFAEYDRIKAEMLAMFTPVEHRINAAFIPEIQDPIEYAKDLFKKICNAHKPCALQIRPKLNRSYMTVRARMPLVRLGRQSINRAFERGFAEYKTLCRIIGATKNQRTEKGLAGVRALVLHEYAHVLSWYERGFVKGDTHRSTFQKYLAILARDF